MKAKMHRHALSILQTEINVLEDIIDRREDKGLDCHEHYTLLERLNKNKIALNYTIKITEDD